MKRRLKLSYVLTECLVCTLLVAVPLIARGEPIEEWVARYSRSENDYARAMAIDASGNVYVTGRSQSSGPGDDYATVKYDTDGNELWVVRYNGPGNGSDSASAIAVDASGNVYVTGGSAGSETGYDYATVKYDTTGNELWVQRYNGSGSGDDQAYAIAVDTSGNVYVTGNSQISETDWDYATVKYDTAGNELWVKQYNGPGNYGDYAEAIAIDASGNVYVTGLSIGSGTDWDYATVKYDTAGNELWVTRYNGPGNDRDGAYAISVDLSGNVYVTGNSHDTATRSDYATVKYDTNGNELWVARYNSPGNGSERAFAIEVDGSGNVYVTGRSGDLGKWQDYATVKYDTNGNELWVARYDSPESDIGYASALAIDSSGNVYVTGDSYTSRGDDYMTIKYDTNGNELWVKRYNGPGDLYDNARAIAVDPLGNIYVTGESDGIEPGFDYDYATVKYVEGIKMALPAGWSMISLPVKPEVATVGTLFPEAEVVYKYQKRAGYVQVAEEENLEVGVGYWILFDAPQSVVIKGTEITEYTMSVEDGWYMIGGCSLPAQKMITNGDIDVIYGYTQGVGYERVLGSEPLEPGKGYWILFRNTSEGAAFTARTSASQ